MKIRMRRKETKKATMGNREDSDEKQGEDESNIELSSPPSEKPRTL